MSGRTVAGLLRGGSQQLSMEITVNYISTTQLNTFPIQLLLSRNPQMPAIPLLAPYAEERDGRELRVEVVILTDCG